MEETKNHIHELSFTIHQWFTLIGIKTNKIFLKDELTTHPDYPALTSVVDVLDAGGIEYLAVRTSMEYAHEFKYPLLAHIKKGNDEQGLVIVKNQNEWSANNELTTQWTGVLLMPEKNAAWKHADNEEYIKTEQNKKQLVVAALFTIFAITVATIAHQTVIIPMLFILLSAGGLLIAWLTFTTEVGLQNQLLKQVCNSINPAGGCSKVLKSKQAKGIAGISPADAALGWFTVQWIFIITGTWISTLLPLQTIAMQFSFVGIAIATWSIFSQKFILKEWCTLCLGLTAVLALQFTTTILSIVTIVNVKAGLVYLFVLSSLLLLVINPIKQLLKTSIKQKPLEMQLRKWKQDANVFMGLWQHQKMVDCNPWQNELQMGDPNAPVQITVACNPYCGPCAIAHKKLNELLEKNINKLGISIRFGINTIKKEELRTMAVQLILQNHLQNSNPTLALSDWFEWMNEEKWKEKYKPDETIDVKDLLQQHADWAKNANIAYTPTFFINDRQLPGQYRIEDVGILLPQLTAILQQEKVLVTQFKNW